MIGAGNSGTDILNHLATIETDQLWVSVRHGPVIFPVRLLGIPMQRLSPLFAIMPVCVADAMLALTEKMAFGNLAKWGLRRWHHAPAGYRYRTGLPSILGHIDVLDDSGVPKIHGDEQMDEYPGLWFTGIDKIDSITSKYSLWR